MPAIAFLSPSSYRNFERQVHEAVGFLTYFRRIKNGFSRYGLGQPAERVVMVASAFARLPAIMRSLCALILLIAGQGITPSFATGSEPDSAGQRFISLIATYNNKSFCIPGQVQVLDVARAVAQYTKAHETSGELTTPRALQILAQIYPCNGPSVAENVGAPKVEEAAPVELQTIDVMRTLQNTAGHENDGVLDQIKKRSDAYPPPVLFGLARVLYLQGDVDGAIFWFNAGRLRGNFDAWRSADVVSGRTTMIALSRKMPIELRKAQFADLPKLRAIIAKVIAWDETTPRHYDKRWIDFHGVVANKMAPGGVKPAPATIPPEKWDDLAVQVREEYRKDLEKSITLMSNAKLPPAQ
jgi:hypothetical protein